MVKRAVIGLSPGAEWQLESGKQAKKPGHCNGFAFYSLGDLRIFPDSIRALEDGAMWGLVVWRGYSCPRGPQPSKTNSWGRPPPGRPV